jgi:hypothetical protein
MKKAYTTVSISPVRAEKRDTAEMVTQLAFGEIVEVESLDGTWAKILTFLDNYSGYVDAKHLRFISEKETNRWLDGLSAQKEIIRQLTTPWGKQAIFRGALVPLNATHFTIGSDKFSFPEENQPIHFENPFDVALTYLNTPYLWGGKTPFGIDCSGLTQVIMRFFDINLPRDAYQQAEHGMDIPFEQRQRGDLAFFSNAEGKIIHVGIIDEKEHIVHASGRVRNDYFTPKGIMNSETTEITHKLTFIKRL